jgi:hypothetical protein
MIAFLPGSASYSLLDESISGFRLAQLCLMNEAQEKLPSESMSQCWRLERPHCVTRLGSICFIGSNWGVEWRDRCQWHGILLYIGWCDCFIPWFSENLAQFLFGKRVKHARILKQQILFIPEILKWSKDRFILIFCLFVDSFQERSGSCPKAVYKLV